MCKAARFIALRKFVRTNLTRDCIVHHGKFVAATGISALWQANIAKEVQPGRNAPVAVENKLDWRTTKCLQLRTLKDRDDRYSAATFFAGSTTSTRAAQYLNSGILPNGSSAGLVRMLAAASTKANGMKITPSGMASS